MKKQKHNQGKNLLIYRAGHHGRPFYFISGQLTVFAPSSVYNCLTVCFGQFLFVINLLAGFISGKKTATLITLLFQWDNYK